MPRCQLPSRVASVDKISPALSRDWAIYIYLLINPLSRYFVMQSGITGKSPPETNSPGLNPRILHFSFRRAPGRLPRSCQLPLPPWPCHHYRERSPRPPSHPPLQWNLRRRPVPARLPPQGQRSRLCDSSPTRLQHSAIHLNRLCSGHRSRPAENVVREH